VSKSEPTNVDQDTRELSRAQLHGPDLRTIDALESALARLADEVLATKVRSVDPDPRTFKESDLIAMLREARDFLPTVGIFGVVNPNYDCKDEEIVYGAYTFADALEKRDCLLKAGKYQELDITALNRGVFISNYDCQQLFGPLRGTQFCPICLWDKPHEHTVEEVNDHQLYGEKKRLENKKRRFDWLEKAKEFEAKYPVNALAIRIDEVLSASENMQPV